MCAASILGVISVMVQIITVAMSITQTLYFEGCCV